MAPKLRPLRPMPYRLHWPLTASQLENADEMFEILFKRVKELSALVNTPSTTPISTSPTFIMMDFGSGGDGDGEMGPPGLIGASGSSGSALDYVVMSDGGTPTPSPVNDGAGNFIYIPYTP